MFQFQTGSIKRNTEKASSELSRRSFNSKLVRLKASYHTGYALYLTRFNSKLVRLEVKLAVSWLALSVKFQFQTGSIRR